MDSNQEKLLSLLTTKILSLVLENRYSLDVQAEKPQTIDPNPILSRFCEACDSWDCPCELD